MRTAELKYQVEQAGHLGAHFFERATMKFFGDTMRNYGVRSAVVCDNLDDEHLVWELYRKRPVKHGLSTPAFFDKGTFRQIFAKS